jgi:hypothetical protein
VRYKAKGLEIRSENAAKPMTIPAAHLVDWLRKMPEVHSALDYGCGKLRYSGIIARKCKALTLVDSEVQLSREQQLGRTRTSVRDLALQYWPKCRALSLEQFSRDKRKYDFILCANVLSAIPDKRIRSESLRRILSSLKRTGNCLFVAQYRSSYFKEVDAAGCVPHLDGWILKTEQGAYYFGVFTLKKLSELVLRHGFSATKGWTKGESAYLLATRRREPYELGGLCSH